MVISHTAQRIEVMRPARSSIELLELALAAAVVLPLLAIYAGVPYPLSSWPEVAGLPANPELLVPGALGLVALVGATWDLLADGLGLSALAVGTLAVVTLWWAVTSWYTLYTPGPGGVFFGGLLTLGAGVVLAVAVLVRFTVRTFPGGPGEPGDVLGP